MWDNFARLTALLAKVRVWFNNLTICLDFSTIFSLIAPSKPLNQGRHWGRLFAAEGRHFDEAFNVTPLGMRREAQGFVKIIAERMELTGGQDYSDCMGFMRKRLRFELLKTTLIALRGYWGREGY